jgi:hypothetical protein
MFEARQDRRPQGRKQLSAERRAFVALMNEGISSAERKSRQRAVLTGSQQGAPT